MRTIFSLVLTMLLLGCSGHSDLMTEPTPVTGVRITIDPGHGDSEAYDAFRVGPSGEREEWINLRVAKILARKLRRAGANVYLTRTRDEDVSLAGRAALAKRHNSVLLVSVHHNGSGNDPNMDLPIVYIYGPASLNPASADFAQILLDSMRTGLTFEQPEAGGVYSDHLIYPAGTSILRNTIDQMPGVIGEGGFFTNPRGEARLKSRAYNEQEAEVYFQAIMHYFDGGLPTAIPLTPDSLEYLELTHEIAFQLDDGFGSSFFEPATFMVLQDGDTLRTRWDIHKGILYAKPHPASGNQVSFQVFGRNFKGQAMHPRPFTYNTKRGFDWHDADKWWIAYDRAELLLHQLESSAGPADLDLIDQALHGYRLSLELQIVHPKARQAEEAILVLLIMKEGLSGETLTAEIAAQTLRLRELYPD